jgi:hypothetical protein
MLTLTTAAVTVATSDAYCIARGYADWTGSEADKTAALRRGQDYIAGEYNYRWLVSFTDATAPIEVQYAIVEAARRELVAAGSLAPDLTPGREKVLTEVKGIKWTMIKSDAKNVDLLPYLRMIRNLLRGIAYVDDVPGALVV